MNKPDKAEKPGKPVSAETKCGAAAAQLFFSATALWGAVVVCGIGGPKIPPWEGD